MKKKNIFVAIALTVAFVAGIFAFFLIVASSDSTPAVNAEITKNITCTVDSKNVKTQGAQKNRNAQITTNCPERLIVVNNKNAKSNANEILASIESGKTYDFTVTAHNQNGVMNIVKVTPAN